MTTRVARRPWQGLRGGAAIELPAAVSVLQSRRQTQQTVAGTRPITTGRQLQTQLQLQEIDNLPPGLHCAGLLNSPLQQLIRLLRVSIGQQLRSPAQTLRTDPAVGTAEQQHRSRLLGLA